MNPKQRMISGIPVPGLLLLAVTMTLAACGGGGSGSNAAPAPQSGAPQLSPLVNQTINQDTATPSLAFTVSDDGGLDGVTLAASSSNADLLPAAGITFGGSGGTRTITVTPAEDAMGSATVTVTATDAQAMTASVTFAVSVQAVTKSIASYASSTFAQMEADTPAQVSGITFIQDADDETTFNPLLQ